MPPLDRRRRRPRRAPGETGPARRAQWRNQVRGLTEDQVFDAVANATAARAQIEEIQAHAPPVLAGVNWTPLGPAGAVRGQTRNRATISGRVKAIEVGPLGRRAYAATADGGVWQYEKVTVGTIDHDFWQPMNDFVMSPSMVNLATSNALAGHALLVQFGATALADTIFVGTGEPGAIPIPGTHYRGIGIQVSPGSAGPRTWHLEANHLAGQAVYRLVADPDNPAIIWAATSAGIFVRPVGAGPNTPWTPIVRGGGTLLPGNREISDLVITGSSATTKTIYAAAQGGAAAAPTRQPGVYRSTDNGLSWTLVPVSPASGVNPGRISLAVSDLSQVVYRFDQPGRLWRLTGGQFVRVQNVPPAGQLVGSSGDWCQAVAVQPGTDDTVYIAGNFILHDRTGPLEPRDYELSLYRSALTSAAGIHNFGYSSGGNPDASPLWIGAGIHPDGHAIAFARNAAGTGFVAGQVWVGCDGGVFHSPTGAAGTFTAFNDTLSITQPTYFDHHPTSDAIVVTGSQDNGSLRGDGGAMWRVIRKGDGGGCAIDPRNPLLVMTQNTNASLFSMTDGGLSGADRAAGPTLSTLESSNFYSRLTTSPPIGLDTTTLLYTTNRVWASYNWGVSWRVLPANVTPGAPNHIVSRLNGANDMISDLKWIAQDRFHACTGQVVFRYDRTTRNADHRTDIWAPVTRLATTGLPAARAITALGVVNPAADDLYCGLGGAGTGNDHVYWYDATAGPPTWLPTNFGPGMIIAGVPAPFDAPVTALVVDPGNPRHLYVGTDVGVFRGERSVAPPFGWTWLLWSNGLPEAGVEDLKVHGPTRRLRATLHGRGLWEFDLAGGATRSPDLYLRMNATDSGRHLPAARGATHPYLPARTVSWTMSPDIKVRRTATAAQVGPAYPGTPIRFRTPVRDTGPNVTRWQTHAARRGFSTAPDPAGTFDVGSRQAARDIQSRFGLVAWMPALAAENIDGVVGPWTWAATTSYPPALPLPVTPSLFADRIGEDWDQATETMLADHGPNDVYLQVHNRGHLDVPATAMRAILLVAASDAAGAVPQLPADYAARIRAGDASPGWLAASGWQFADVGVYRNNPLEINHRRPAIVSWTVDFVALGFAPGDFAMLLALVNGTGPILGGSDTTLQAGQRNVQTLIEGVGAAAGETKAAARLVRIDAVVAIP